MNTSFLSLTAYQTYLKNPVGHWTSHEGRWVWVAVIAFPKEESDHRSGWVNTYRYLLCRGHQGTRECNQLGPE